ncbi:MAG: PMCA-type calcium-translocating P-type ATPase [Benniella sp.]|nr:MAG: PMCA-type calcium-translocating P-type ATPase [Benniella sp.]
MDKTEVDLSATATDHNAKPTSASREPTNGPFTFTPDDFMALIDPKAPEKLDEYGGTQSIIAALHTDPEKGLATENTPLTAVVSSDEKDSQVDTLPSKKKVSFAEREEFFGRNVIPKRKPKSILELMWIALQEKILILLLIAAVVSIGLGIYEDYGMDHPTEPLINDDYTVSDKIPPKIAWVEGVAILFAVVIVVLVGSVNDYQKELQFRKLNAKKEDREVKVIRNGETVLVSVFDVVVGDILHLEPGDVVAADGIFLGGHNLKCDESALTGEPDAIKKVNYEEFKKLEEAEAASRQPGDNAHHALPHIDPFIISGSKVLEGVGLYVVTGVGPNSFNGRTMMSLAVESDSTPLQDKLNNLAEQIAKLGSLSALLMLIVLFIRYFIGFKKNGVAPATTKIVESVVSIVISAVTVIVVAVPEGLPLAVTLALAFATTRMLKDNNLVRVLAACETMGNATTVCSDKTGTLTQNRMTIVAGTLGINTRFISDVGEGDVNQRANLPINKNAVVMSQLVGNLPSAVTKLLHETIAINSSAFESEDDKGNLSFIGSKTEVALLDFSKKTGAADYRKIREASPVTHLYPFSSERKSMATIVQMGPKKFRLHAKGASEIIMKRCTKVVQISSAADQSTPLSDKDRNADITELELNADLQNQIHKTIVSYATQSLRTIGIAYRDFESWPPAGVELNEDGEVPFSAVAEDNMTLIGVVGIEDPLRDGVPEAVAACQRAGVFVRMVTGDNILTAKSIATQCGIYTQGGIIMEGPKFRALSEEEMDAVIPRLQVLARSSPEDKKILVGRLKALGEIVAVTGDGTNDGPALKMSDVGFSMGIAGTEVAKEASSIILMDDNFSSIVKAILWGRSVNDAVKKFLQFQLTVNVTAVLLTFVTAVASDDQKPVMSAVQLLWVNLIMDTLAALALATDPPTPDLLDRQPEPRTAPLISFTMWKMILGQAVLQLIITFVLEYKGMDILGYNTVPSSVSARIPNLQSAEGIQEFEKLKGLYTNYKRQELKTMVFNAFVFLQIFNELNSRRLDNRLNIFSGIQNNRYFIVIFIIMLVFQAVIVEFGGSAFKTSGLDGTQWGICIGLGFLSLPFGVLIRLIPNSLFGGLPKWVDHSPPPHGALPDFEGHPAGSEGDRANSMPISVNSNRTNSMGSGSNVYPSRDGLVWNSAMNKVRSDLSVFRSIRGGRLSTDSDRSERPHVVGAGAMVPILVATSVGAPHRNKGNNSGSQVSQVSQGSRPSFAGSRRGTGQSVQPATQDAPVNSSS